MSADPILLECDPPLAWIVLNRPAKMNALNADMWRALTYAVHELEANDDISVILLRGAGEQAFSAGADIAELQQALDTPETSAVQGGATEDALAALAHCAKPTVGVVQGRCMGGGCAIVLALDIRIAAEHATFALTPARLGIGYPLAGIERAVHELGPAAARFLFMTGEPVTAQQALTMGLVQCVYPPDAVLYEGRHIAETIARNAPKTIRAVREAVRQSMLAEPARDTTTAEALIQACFESEDYREGLQAFLERREPRFRDR